MKIAEQNRNERQEALSKQDSKIADLEAQLSRLENDNEHSRYLILQEKENQAKTGQNISLLLDKIKAEKYFENGQLEEVDRARTGNSRPKTGNSRPKTGNRDRPNTGGTCSMYPTLSKTDDIPESFNEEESDGQNYESKGKTDTSSELERTQKFQSLFKTLPESTKLEIAQKMG